MAVILTFEPRLVEFTVEQRDAWRRGDRSECIDPYCAGIGGGEGTGGFGEYLVGKFWQDLGYRWVHHDFDIFGGNVDGKYEESQAILENALGDRLAQFKTLVDSLRPFQASGHAPVEQPDLLIYKPGTAEIRFAECKRTDTRDKVNSRQALGLYLITSQLRVPVDVFILAEQGTRVEPLTPITFTYDDAGVSVAG